MKLVLLLVAVAFSLSSMASNIEISSVDQAQIQTERGDFYYVDFGQVPINRRVTNAYQLRNTGTTDIVFQDDIMWGMDFNGRHNCFGVLRPYQTCRIEITFWPGFEGPARGTYVMRFNNSDADLEIDLRGYGVRR